MTADDERFIDRVWLPMWEGTQGARRDLERHARRLLRLYPAAIAEHIRDTSDAPRADWRQYHELAGLDVPPMPGADDQYDYDWLGYGLLLKLPGGTVFLQGDEASELYDQLEEITDPAVLEAVLSEYSVLIED